MMRKSAANASSTYENCLSETARPEGLEPSTYGLEIRCSIRLSYGRRMSTDIYRVSRRMKADEQSIQGNQGVKPQMKQHEVTVPQIGLIAGTRAMLGAGIALLLSEKLSTEQRRAIGWTLVAVGALTTIPLALQLLSEDE